MFIYQPALERVLREGVNRYPSVDVRLEREAGAFRELADGVEIAVTDLRDGTASVVRGRYLLACDGGSSPIRTQLGIGFEGRHIEDLWVGQYASGPRSIACAFTVTRSARRSTARPRSATTAGSSRSCPARMAKRSRARTTA